MTMVTAEKIAVQVSSEEQSELERRIMVWINTFPGKPVNLISYEGLPADGVGMALSAIQGACITKRYILGGYEAEYQFRVVYRIKPNGSDNARLEADAALNRLGDWAAGEFPDIGAGLAVRRIEATTRSAVMAVYQGGDEDHQILMKITYERV